MLPPPKSCILISDISDHFPICTSIPSQVFKKNRDFSFVGTRDYSNECLNNLSQDLRESDWSSVYNTDDPNFAFNDFINKFNLLHDKNTPIKQNKKQKQSVPKSPWISVSLLKSIHLKNKLYSKFIRKRNETNHTNYTRYRNVLTKVLRIAKRNYYYTQFENEKNNVKNTWKIIHSVLNKQPVSKKISTISFDGKVVDDPRALATLFNDYFVNIGPNLASKIPHCVKPFQEYLPSSNSDTMFFAPATKQEVINAITP